MSVDLVLISTVEVQVFVAHYIHQCILLYFPNERRQMLSDLSNFNITFHLLQNFGITSPTPIYICPSATYAKTSTSQLNLNKLKEYGKLHQSS